MLAEAAGIQKIILAVGYTDLRKGVDSLAQLIGTKYDLNPFEKDILFLFCGRRTDRIKGLVWEGNGFLLLYKRLEDGAFSWPRTPEEAAQLTPEEYKQLMMGLNPLHPKIRDVSALPRFAEGTLQGSEDAWSPRTGSTRNLKSLYFRCIAASLSVTYP